MTDSDDYRRAAFSDAAANPHDWKPTDPDLLAADLAASHPHYRITAYISHGGMGAVYRAVDERPGAPFPEIAIKFIRHDLKDDSEYLQKFEKEIIALQRISNTAQDKAGDEPAPHHLGNIRILDHGRTADGVPFLVMPFLHGETLTHLLEKPRLDLPRALRLMGKICAAVAHAHENRIVHGDLKPANIHLIPGTDGEIQPVIIDYGLARTRRSPADHPTLPGQYHGTAGYTAPEVIRGQAASYPADVFALGKICIQLLNGNDERVTIPPHLKPVILEATADTIGLRIPTAGEFARALEEATRLTANSSSAMSNVPATDYEYPTPDPESIVIEFTETTLTVNGLDFSLTTTIEDWMQVLGRYSEVESSQNRSRQIDTYLWPNIGLCIRMINNVFEEVSLTPAGAGLVEEAQAYLFKPSNYFSPFKGKVLFKQSKIEFTSSGIEKAFGYSVNSEYPINRFAWPSRTESFVEHKPSLPWSTDEREFTLRRENVWQSRDEKMLDMAWSAGAVFLVPGLHLVLFSLTRLSVNRYENLEIFSKLETDSRSVDLAAGERVLLDIHGGRHRKFRRLNLDSRITPERIILTDKRLLLVEAPGKAKSFDPSDARLGYLVKRPKGTWWQVLIGVIIFTISFGIFFAAAFLLENLSDFGLPKWGEILAGLVLWPASIFFGAFPFYVSVMFYPFVLTSHFEGWYWMSWRRSFWDVDIKTPLGVLKYRLPSNDLSDSRTTTNFSDFSTELCNRHHLKNLYLEDVGQREYGFFSRLDHLLKLLASDRLLKFPVHTRTLGQGYRLENDLVSVLQKHPCPTCSHSVAKTARSCPKCGEDLRSRQKAVNWRQKNCPSCGGITSRFSNHCQQHDCGHPNMWMKIQTFVATGLILLGAVWTWLHFRESGTKGIEIPALFTAAAVGWRFVLGTLKSFYSH